MKKKFLGLSDDGYRVYTMWTPGEKGDCGIVMTVGYRDKEFMVYDSEAWDNEAEQREERAAQDAADQMRGVMNMMRYSSFGIRGLGKSRLVDPLAQQGSFKDLEAKVIGQTLMMDNWKPYVPKNPKVTVTPDQQGQPKRKPQPNRGPIGRKDWK